MPDNPQTIVIKGRSFSFTSLLLVVALLVIGYLVFFDDNNAENERERLLKEKVENLEKEKNYHLRRADSLLLENDTLIFQNQLFAEQDSIKQAQIEEQQRRTQELLRQKEIAERARREAERRLRDFRENPTELKGVDLILDTEKRINR